MCRRKNWEGWGVTHATLERHIFKGFVLTNVCAQEALMGTEVWDKERVRREKESGGGCSHQRTSQRLYRLMRDVAETLKPSDPDSHTQTDRQARGLTNLQWTESLRRTYSLSWR